MSRDNCLAIIASLSSREILCRGVTHPSNASAGSSAPSESLAERRRNLGLHLERHLCESLLDVVGVLRAGFDETCASASDRFPTAMPPSWKVSRMPGAFLAPWFRNRLRDSAEQNTPSTQTETMQRNT